jgi:N-formylglutamate deformylase
VTYRKIPGVLELLVPDGPALPLVFDSPHSGTRWPDDFRPAAPELQIRKSQDSYVHELFAAAPANGAALLHALWPRAYIDPNRALTDLDPALLSEPWPGELAPTEKTARGLGLIWRLAPPGDSAIYDRPLTVAEVEARIDRYWCPYHALLGETIRRLHGAHGRAVHIDCHSMHSTSSTMHQEGAGVSRPDFVLGDRDGTTCDPALTRFVRDFLERRGCTVAINDPYKGVELVRAWSDPAVGRHSLQIEINRRLYLDETTLERGRGFVSTRDMMDELIQALAGLVRDDALSA